MAIPGATKTATKHEATAAERARRRVASAALDAADCRLLLDMLGLVPVAVESAVEAP